MDNFGRTKCYNYDENEYGESNNLIEETNIQTSSRNYILNHGFELESLFSENDYGWKLARCINATVTTQPGGVFGNKCLNITTQKDGVVEVTQNIKNINVAEFQLNCFINTGILTEEFQDVQVIMDYEYKIDETIEELSNIQTIIGDVTSIINRNKVGWYKLSTESLVIPERAYDINLQIRILVSGSNLNILLDDFYLSSEKYNSRYNMIENGYMEFIDENNHPLGWEYISLYDDGSVVGYENDDEHLPIFGKNVFLINAIKTELLNSSHTLAYRNLSQTISCSGKSGEQFVISALCKANITSNTEFYIKVTLDYETYGEKYYKIPFSKNLNHWQMMTKGIVTEDNYNSIKIEIIYNGVGNAYIDCVQLYKDIVGTYYSYDEYDNLTIVNKNNKIHKVNYNNKNQITEIHTSNGKHIIFEYDNKNRLYKLKDHDKGTTTYTYDDKNRLISKLTTLINGEIYESTTIYDDDAQTYVVTDENGYSITYSYDDLNRIKEVAYSNGLSKQFSYNNKNQIIKIQTSFDSIVYKNILDYNIMDNLSKITRGSRAIDYSYDCFGRIKGISIDGVPFLNYSYNNIVNGISTSELTNMNFVDSGEGYKYEYTQEGNLSKIYLNDRLIASFIYDENNRLYNEIVYNDDDNISNEKIYEYDLNNNLINSFDTNNLITHHTYDNLDNLQKSVYKRKDNYLQVEYEYPYEFNEYSKNGFIRRLLNLYCDDLVFFDYSIDGINGADCCKITAMNNHDSTYEIDEIYFSDCYDHLWYDLSTANNNRVDFSSLNDTLNKEEWKKRFIYNKTFYFWIYPTKRYSKTNILTFQNIEYIDGIENNTLLSNIRVNSNGTLGYSTYNSDNNVYTTSGAIKTYEWNLVGIRFMKEVDEEKTKCFMILNNEVTDMFEIEESVVDITHLIFGYGNEPTITTTTTASGKSSTSINNSLKMPFYVCLISIGAFDYTEKEFAGIYSESKKFLFNSAFSINSTASTIFYDPNVYSEYEVITLNGSLESQNKLNPEKIFRKDYSYTVDKSKLFKYDFSLKKHVFGCFDNDSQLIRSNNSLLGYNLNIIDECTISFKFRVNDNICTTNKLRCIMSSVLDNEEKIGIYYNDEKNIVISSILYDEEKDEYVQTLEDTTIQITDTNWHHLVLTFNNTIKKLYIDDLSYVVNKNINLLNATTYLGDTPIGYGSLKPLRGYYEMFAFKSTLEENPEILINNGNSIVIRNRFDISGKLVEKEIVVNDEGYIITYDYDKMVPKKQILRLFDNNEDLYDSIECTYDLMGNVIRKAFYLSDIVKLGYEYTYDKLGRLLTTIDNQGNEITYSYDDIGNILSREILKDNGLIKESYQYDSTIKDKLLTISDVNTGEILYELKYDNNQFYPSKITKRGLSYNLAWDGNRLKSFGNIEFEYNYQGVRTKKINGNTVTKYYVDKNNIIYEVEEVNGVEQNIKEYIYNSNNEVVCIKYDNKYYFYIRDILGNIIGLLDTQNNFVVEYQYSDYGEVISITGRLASTLGQDNPFRYKGYYYDVETQLYWVSSRYYSPELCRWISPDSIEYLDPESINGLNLYAYCNNDPVNKYDPTGHIAISLIVGLVVSFAIGTTASAISQYAQYGDVNWLQAGVDGLFAVASTALAYTGIGLIGSIAAGAGMGLAQYTLDSAVFHDDFSWSGALIATGLGALGGLASGRGAQHFKSIGSNLDDTGRTGVKAILTAFDKYGKGAGYQKVMNLWGGRVANSLAKSISQNFTKSALIIWGTTAATYGASYGLGQINWGF